VLLVDLSSDEDGQLDVFHLHPHGRVEVAYGDLEPHLLVFALGRAEGVDHLYSKDARVWVGGWLRVSNQPRINPSNQRSNQPSN
jgi:hypothetical protein